MKQEDLIKAFAKNLTYEDILEGEAYAKGYVDGFKEKLKRQSGKWIDGEYINGHAYYRCNKCFAEIDARFFGENFDINYCPCCGADMRNTE